MRRKSSARIEVANYQKAIQTAFREVADALVATAIMRSKWQGASTLIAAQQRRYDLANLRYRQGDDTYLNVLSAQQDLYSAQQGLLADTTQQTRQPDFALQALGGGWK
jgi:multidrug efflux system outer membrane protein